MATAVVDILRRYVFSFLSFLSTSICVSSSSHPLHPPPPNSLAVDERTLLKPWLAGLDPFPPLGPDAALTAGGVLLPEELQRLEDARQALVRASSVEGNDNAAAAADDEIARAARVLLEQARRCAATLSRGGSEGGMAGEVAKLVALQALVARLSPLPAPAGGRAPAGPASSSSDPAVALRLAGQGGTGRELRRVLVPPLLELCRGGGEAGLAVQLEAARALGALGAVPPWELMLWDPYDPTAVGEDGRGAVGGVGGGGHGGTQGRTRGRSKGQDAHQQQASASLPPIQVRRRTYIRFDDRNRRTGLNTPTPPKHTHTHTCQNTSRPSAAGCASSSASSRAPTPGPSASPSARCAGRSSLRLAVRS